jgi:hypothetical protein
MKFRSVLYWLAGAVLIAAAYKSYGWQGVLLVSGAILFYLLLHFNRMMQALKRAANRPIGYVASAVMLNTKLKPGLTLLHVVALTRSLGALQSPKDTQPEIFRWTDAGDSFVVCRFVNGKLAGHELIRPSEPVAVPAAGQDAAPSA